MNNSDVFMLDNYNVKRLISSTEACGKGWSRICLHQSPSDHLHAMIMCMLPGVKSGMHRHTKNTDIVTYSYLGSDFSIKVNSISEALPYNFYCLNKSNPVLSLPDNIFRSVENNSSEPIIYLEHRLGPYIQDDILWL